MEKENEEKLDLDVTIAKNRALFLLIPVIGKHYVDYYVKLMNIDNENKYKTISLDKNERLFHITFHYVSDSQPNNTQIKDCSFNLIIVLLDDSPKIHKLKNQVYEPIIEVRGYDLT